MVKHSNTQKRALCKYRKTVTHICVLIFRDYTLSVSRYILLNKEIVEYEEIFRPQDLPLPLFLKAILIALNAQHLLYAQTKGEYRNSKNMGKWSFLKP